MPPPRPRNSINNTVSTSGRPGPSAPMSERQQMALLMQMTSSTSPSNVTGSDNQTSGTRSASVKKNLDSKKGDEQEELNNSPTTHQSKEGDDENDFKDLIKEEEKNKSSEEQNSDEKNLNSSSGMGGNPNTASASNKRVYTDVENCEEGTETEESKRKKRKESDTNKESFKRNSSSSGAVRGEKLKSSNLQGKAGISSSSKSNTDRKSPCASPKTSSDVEAEEFKSSEAFACGGPKVPPLKIVIPQQNTGNDTDGISRNGKSNSNRNHQALPYVVPSSNASNDCASSEKEGTVASCDEHQDEKFGKATSEERAQQRVLRSSHRSGQNSDRNSNNSSPQLQSSSPSPAQAATESSENLQRNNNSTAPSPSAHNTTESDGMGNAPSPSASSTSSSKDTQQNAVELHPRKRKIRTKQEEQSNKSNNVSINSSNENVVNSSEVHPHDHPFTNCYQMYLNIRKQMEKKHKVLFPVQPRPPQCFKDYLLNRRSYLIASKGPEVKIVLPGNLIPQLHDLFTSQEKERHKLRMQHIVEKEKLVLSVEQEILRVHAKAARILACQSVPFSVCTFLKDQEVYNLITPEQEEKDRNARSRYNGRLFLSWLQDIDDKWEKIKESMVLRHHNEAESLHAVQKMDWECAMKESALCDFKSHPEIDDCHVPMVHVSDEFDLLPA